MPKGRSLTESEKGAIIALKAEGVSMRQISIRIGRSVNVVSQFLKDPERYGTIKRSGRKEKLSSRDKRRIVRLAAQSSKSLRRIAAESELDISVNTVRKVLKNSGIIVREHLMPAPRILPQHREARLSFARENMATDWSRVSLKTQLLK